MATVAEMGKLRPSVIGARLFETHFIGPYLFVISEILCGLRRGRYYSTDFQCSK